MGSIIARAANRVCAAVVAFQPIAATAQDWNTFDLIQACRGELGAQAQSFCDDLIAGEAFVLNSNANSGLRGICTRGLGVTAVREIVISRLENSPEMWPQNPYASVATALFQELPC